MLRHDREERRTRREPVSQILGVKGFWKIMLRVTPEVLTPRPETETILDVVLAEFPPARRFRVLDLGVGSGAIVLAILAAVWLIVTAVSTLRARSWIRASAVTWQVLQIAVAIGSFQGLYARPDLGWALLVPALVGIGLALSPGVIRATSRPRSDES